MNKLYVNFQYNTFGCLTQSKTSSSVYILSTQYPFHYCQCQ